MYFSRFEQNEQSKSLYGINLSHLSLAERKELEEAIYADQQRLTEEKQTLLNMTLTHEIGDHKLQFKPLLARLYASRKYAPLWTDNAAARQLLRDYAAMVASGISKSSATSLETLTLVEQQGGLAYDVLLSDILLDYLYYTKMFVLKHRIGCIHLINIKQNSLKMIIFNAG